MNRLLVFLGIAAILIGGFFIANNSGFISSDISDSVPGFLFSPILLGIVIIALGFIRFNKLIGIVAMILGALLILSSTEVLPFYVIPAFLYPWILIVMGARFLLVGFLSVENKA